MKRHSRLGEYLVLNYTSQPISGHFSIIGRHAAPPCYGSFSEFVEVGYMVSLRLFLSRTLSSNEIPWGAPTDKIMERGAFPVYSAARCSAYILPSLQVCWRQLGGTQRFSSMQHDRSALLAFGPSAFAFHSTLIRFLPYTGMIDQNCSRCVPCQALKCLLSHNTGAPHNHLVKWVFIVIPMLQMRKQFRETEWSTDYLVPICLPAVLTLNHDC